MRNGNVIFTTTIAIRLTLNSITVCSVDLGRFDGPCPLRWSSLSEPKTETPQPNQPNRKDYK